MRIPLGWLKEYVDAKISAKELSDKLTMSGTENEILRAEKGSFEGIVVGEILEISKHPNADKLQVTKTSVGKETLQIVCGAPNIEVGQKVPVALIGAQIGEFEIKEAELRGVKSHGMLCSEAELGISDEHSGIMILDPRSKVGDKLSSALNIGDTVLEAEITPNRGDCLSMLGIAREVSAITGQKVKSPAVKIKESKEVVSDFLSVEIKDKDLCRRYIGRVIANVKVGPSPQWIQDRLSASGVRPINNVVDVTNYVMLEMGQPLHAFDMDKLTAGSKQKAEIMVRRSKKGEKIQTLDGVTRELSSEDLVIADNEKTIAVAGVMGGADSEISEETNTVILESANFNGTAIRKTALSLGLRTEGSARHEKGLPLQLTEEAADRAAQLLAEVAAGEVLTGRVDVGEKKGSDIKVSLDFKRIESFLGKDIDAGKAVSILESLGFRTISKNKETTEFLVPYWRLDISIEEDLLEEIARIYGYENIPSTLPEGTLPEYEKNEKIEISKKIREVMTVLGFFEVYSYSFTNKEKAGLYRRNIELARISNPLSQEQEYMRGDLLGSMLEIVSKNNDYSSGKTQGIYEIANVYSKDIEVLKLSGVMYGGEKEAIFKYVKGTCETIFGSLGLKKVSYIEGEGISAKIFSEEKEIGSFVNLDDAVTKRLKVKSKGVWFFEIDLMTLSGLSSMRKFHKIPKFPSSERDLTFVVEEKVTVAEICEIIDKVKNGVRAKVEVIDVYRGKGVESGRKSVSVRFTYQSEEKTLTDKEVDDDQKAIIKKIKDVLGGTLRGEGS